MYQQTFRQAGPCGAAWQRGGVRGDVSSNTIFEAFGDYVGVGAFYLLYHQLSFVGLWP